VAALDLLGSSSLNNNIDSSGHLRPLWPPERVAKLSYHSEITKVVALGTVFAAELTVPKGEELGYASGVARRVTTRMRAKGVYARPLGNVVYLMITPTSSAETAAGLLDVLEECL
jgi:bifunctional dethiobiotin synthetase / adenosylmethionine---8-amino-7-oxononanoate aminotransferase